MELDTQYFKQKLGSEKGLLEEELAGLGVMDPNSPGEWLARSSDLEVDQADRNEVADKVEESEENRAILAQLEVRYKNVLRALQKIEDGTYGVDELDGEPIEVERLEANPAARTRKANIERESELS